MELLIDDMVHEVAALLSPMDTYALARTCRRFWSLSRAARHHPQQVIEWAYIYGTYSQIQWTWSEFPHRFFEPELLWSALVCGQDRAPLLHPLHKHGFLPRTVEHPLSVVDALLFAKDAHAVERMLNDFDIMDYEDYDALEFWQQACRRLPVDVCEVLLAHYNKHMPRFAPWAHTYANDDLCELLCLALDVHDWQLVELLVRSNSTIHLQDRVEDVLAEYDDLEVANAMVRLFPHHWADDDVFIEQVVYDRLNNVQIILETGAYRLHRRDVDDLILFAEHSNSSRVTGDMRRLLERYAR